jgi:flagellin-like hook-associated protein FlgL
LSTGTDNQTTKALEWMVEKVAEAKANGYWLDKIASFSAFDSAPGAARTFVSAPAATAGQGASQADVDRAVDRAARAEAQVVALGNRVEKLEKDVQALATHLEEAVGSYEEGEHKSHWWSRKA